MITKSVRLPQLILVAVGFGFDGVDEMAAALAFCGDAPPPGRVGWSGPRRNKNHDWMHVQADKP